MYAMSIRVSTERPNAIIDQRAHENGMQKCSVAAVIAIRFANVKSKGILQCVSETYTINHGGNEKEIANEWNET